MASFEELRHQAEHPNGAYHLIKLYTQDWHNVVTANPCKSLSLLSCRGIVNVEVVIVGISVQYNFII